MSLPIELDRYDIMDEEPIVSEKNSNILDQLLDLDSKPFHPDNPTVTSQTVFPQNFNSDIESQEYGNSLTIYLENDGRSQSETFGSMSAPENESLFSEVR